MKRVRHPPQCNISSGDEIVDQERKLPIRVQTEYNHMLYLAFPLCVGLATGLRDWVESRLVRALGCCRLDNSGRLFVHADFLDAYRVSEPLDPHTVPLADALSIRSISEYARQQIDEQRYVVAFTDTGYLLGEPQSFVHELLVYGYRTKSRELLAVGFDIDRRFKALRFGVMEFDESFIRAKAVWTAGTSRMSHPIQLLSAPESTPSFDPQMLLSELHAYCDERPIDPHGEYWSGIWWMNQVPPWYTEAEYFFGIDVYEAFRRLADDDSWPKLFDMDYRVFHFLMQHTYGLVKRVKRLLRMLEIDAPELESRWADLARTVDAGRLRVLMQTLTKSGAPFAVPPERIKLWRKSEQSLLEETLLMMTV